MKKNLKPVLIGFLFGILVSGGVGVAAVTLTAKEISYTPSNEKFTATNAEEALNEIYKIAEYEIPENTYFYEEGTEGNSETIVRYKKINDEYFVCNSYGKVSEGTTATDVTAKKLLPYIATSSNNLSAGTAGFASNYFILGDGSDNKASYDLGKSNSQLTIRTVTHGNNNGDFTTTTYINGIAVISFGGDVDPGYSYSNTWEKNYTYNP